MENGKVGPFLTWFREGIKNVMYFQLLLRQKFILYIEDQ